MDRSAYDRYYSIDADHFWRIARRSFILDTVEAYRPQRAGLEILDVGSACTLVGRELARFGHVTIVEPDQATVDFARGELGLDAFCGSLPDGMPVAGPFDVVTLLDVIEHIDDDVAALDAVRKLMRPDGLLVVTVPALMWLWSPHDEAVHHRRRYVRKRLVDVLDRAGFDVLRVTYFTSLLLPALAGERFVKRLKRGKPQYDASIPPAPINTAFGKVMRLERLLLDRSDLPLGSSLLAACRPKNYV